MKKKQKQEEERPLTITAAAKKLGISRQTLSRAISLGEIKAFRITEHGHFRILPSEIERILRGRK